MSVCVCGGGNYNERENYEEMRQGEQGKRMRMNNDGRGRRGQIRASKGKVGQERKDRTG